MGTLTCQLELHEANKETPSMPTTVNALIAPHTSLLTPPLVHLLTSNSVRILDAIVGPYLGSDQRPILMQCTLKGSQCLDFL